MTQDEFAEKYIRPAMFELVRKFLAREPLTELESKVLDYVLMAGPPVEIQRRPEE